MEIIFYSIAYDIDPSRDGTDVLFRSKIIESSDLIVFHVVGSKRSGEMSDVHKDEYAQLLFSGLVQYIKAYWQAHHDLPAEDTPIQGAEFESKATSLIDWRNYQLKL